MSSKDKGSLVARRTLQVLLLFQENKKLTLSEISKSLAISQTATYRIVSTLSEMGFLVRDENKRYSLGSILLKLARMIEPNLRNIAIPIMNELSKKTQESVYISVSNNPRYYVFIEGVESPHPLKWSVDIGEPIFPYAGSVGKAHLASLRDHELDQILSEIDLVPYTSNTITNKNELLEDLKKIRNEGYSLSNGERYDGVIGISVPIADFSNSNFIAVLSIFIPEYRYEQVKLAEYISSLKHAANKILSHV